VRGKPSYMSPEQCAGEPLDGRADLYSAGVMLWEMLAHRALFAGTSKEILAQVMFKDVATPSSVRCGVPADVEAIAMKLLARDRDQRYPTAEAAIEALLRCDDVPRDGRGELAHLLAERFPRAGGARRSRTGRPGAASTPCGLRAAQITAAALPSTVVGAASDALSTGARPRRRVLAVTVSGAVLGCLAAAVVIARGEVARSGNRAAPVVPAAPAPDGRAAVDAGAAVEPAVPAVPVLPPPVPASPPGKQAVRAGEPVRARSLIVEPDQTATLERTW